MKYVSPLTTSVALRLGLAVAGLNLGLLFPSAQAANVYWDTNGASAGATEGTVADGAWDPAATANWSTNAAGTATTTTYATANGGAPSLADVFFSAGSNATDLSTITLSGGVEARSLTLEEGAIKLVGGDPLALNLGGGGLTIAATAAGDSSMDSTLPVNLSAAQTWTNNISNSFTINGVISSTSATTFGLSGNFTLGNSANTYTGKTTINSGTVIAKSSSSGTATFFGSSATASGDVSVVNGATLKLMATGLTGNLQFLPTNANLAISGSGVGGLGALIMDSTAGQGVRASVGTMTIAGPTTISALGGVAANANLLAKIGGTGDITKIGDGYMLWGNAANSYVGSLTVAAGTLSTQSQTANKGVTGNFTINNGATLGLNRTEQIANSADGVINGTLDLNNDSTVGRSYIETLGTLAGTDVGAKITISNSAAGNNSVLITSGISGTKSYAGFIENGTQIVSLTKGGAYTQILSGTNTQTGLTSVTGGTLATAGTGTLGGGNVTLTDNVGVTLTLGSAVSFADTALLTFGPTNTIINLNFSGVDALAGITNGIKTIGVGSYTAADLNSFFVGANFMDTGFLGGRLMVVPEPGSLAMLLGGVGTLAFFRRRRA